MDRIEVLAYEILSYFPKILGALITLAIGSFLIRILTKFIHRILNSLRISPSIVSLGVSGVTILAWIILISALFQVLGLSQIALAVSGSVALVALAVANAASGTTADIIAGLFLVTDDDFEIGYKVKAAGVEGVIQRIDIRKTRIMDSEGKLHVIPNKTVEGAEWIVISRD
ncbi:MAG TPA: mechanosensitive ion channel domain-containing protein [Candidatus Limnocylindrales bacterium]|nr:mechanosensitive ion channel domain-containing protein [Candidatus Limnocylindrales bacterium]